MDSEILTWLLIAACAAGFGGGAAWQAMRRHAPARTRRNVDKVAARPVKAVSYTHLTLPTILLV